MAEVASLSAGITLEYFSPLFSQLRANSGVRLASRSQRTSDRQMGVAPPVVAACSQKKNRWLGKSGVCAISWCRRIVAVGGASLAVKTRGVLFTRTAFDSDWS